MLKSIYRYGVDRPVLTWLIWICGIVMIFLHRHYLWLGGIFLCLLGLGLVFRTVCKYRTVDGLIHRCNLRTARKILDIGTGRGYFMVHVTKAAGYIAFVTGIEDQNHDNIRSARKNAKRARVNNRINVIHGDVRHLPFPEAAFDLVTTMETNSGVIRRHSGEYQAVCDAVIRVLKPNGKFILVGCREDVDRVANYLKTLDHVKVRTSVPGKWRPFKWGTLAAQKMI